MSDSLVKKVPGLRFRGFSDAWQEKKLGEITTKVGSGSTPRGGSSVYKTSGVPFIRSQNVVGGILEMKGVVFIDAQTHQSMSNSQIKPDDVLLNITGASLGRTCVVPRDFKEGNLSQHVCIIRLKPETSPKLIQTLLSTPSGLHELLKTQTGGGKEGLNFQAIRSFKVLLPNEAEQEKIAGFLGVVDDKISGLQSKKLALKKYKKAAMQQIFSQKLRFKDENGKDYPTWQVKTFGSLYSFLRTNSLSRAELSDTGNIKNIHYGDIHMRLATNFDSSKELIGFVAEQNGSDLCNEGDLVIADASEDRKDIGKAIEIIKTNGDKIVAGLHTFLARPLAHTTAVGFSGYLMQIQAVRKQVMRIANGASVLGISKGELAKVVLVLPSNEEQQKIADFLTSLDNKINLIQKELEQAKQFKKALLQRMFV